MTFVVMAAILPVFKSILPLPVWRTPWQPGMFVRGAAIGFVLPFLATAWPVWRAVRVMPVDAITTTHASARSGLAPLLRRLRWPVSAFRRMPFGNVLRAPRRTALTALGIGAAVAALVVVLGMLDSFNVTMDRNKTELLGKHPDRIAATLDGIVHEGGPELTAVGGSALRRRGGTRAPPRRHAVDTRPSRTSTSHSRPSTSTAAVWAPTFEQGGLRADRAGLVLSRKAADDLGVTVGDTVTLKHPARQGNGFAVVETPMPVAAIHPSPFRFNAYIDRTQLDTFGLAGAANAAYLLPATGATSDDVERELFDLPGVTSVQPVAVATQVAEDSLQEFTGIFQVLELFILVLALLIAYNATSINADERARERATLFAFGMRPRRGTGPRDGGRADDRVARHRSRRGCRTAPEPLDHHVHDEHHHARHGARHRHLRRHRAHRHCIRHDRRRHRPALHRPPAPSHGHSRHPARGRIARRFWHEVLRISVERQATATD